jgi:hypothetical protein
MLTKTGASGGYAQQSVVSQFVTVDEAGLVIFWVTSEKGQGFLDTTGEWDTGCVICAKYADSRRACIAVVEMLVSLPCPRYVLALGASAVPVRFVCVTFSGLLPIVSRRARRRSGGRAAVALGQRGAGADPADSRTQPLAVPQPQPGGWPDSQTG